MIETPNTEKMSIDVKVVKHHLRDIAALVFTVTGGGPAVALGTRPEPSHHLLEGDGSKFHCPLLG